MLNITEYTEAKTELLAAAKAYYADGSSELSDAEFDALEAAVIEFETKNPTQVIGTPAAEAVAAGADVAGDVRHVVPMLSLEKITDDVQALTNWLVSRDLTNNDLVVVEPKLDGSSMAIRYENGRPVQMLTRGDGQMGEDRTAALDDIVNIPTQAGTFTGEVRGEVIFTRAQFTQANIIREAHGKAQFANARNGAAERCRALQAATTASR